MEVFMKTAIPVVEDRGLDSPVARSFMEAPLFFLASVEGSDLRLELYENPAKDEQELLELLLSYGVKRVVGRELPPKTEEGLKLYGVEVVKEEYPTLAKALEALFS
jgi:predicted Fe-Mo cluster-binding NifX family protein